MDDVARFLGVLRRRGARVFLAGYAHIDSEWLWGLEETSRVCVSTFRSVLGLMERFRGVVFVQGAVLYYELVERSDPELFHRVLGEVRRGRWRIVGAPFLEFDAYMPSGESLVRHLLQGRRFSGRHGVPVEPVVFLPDSFGFPSSLPRILRGFGIRFFVTYKPNWNDTNRVRHHLFYWGERPEEAVLAYILPGSYSDYLSSAKRVLWNLYKQFTRQGIPVVLVVYGRGDHGGGPEEIEVRNVEHWRTRLGRFIVFAHSGMREFLEHVEEAYGEELPLVRDELYLEFHRGVFTTGAAVKRLNRVNESLVIGVEKLYTLLAAVYGAEFPAGEVEEAWRGIMLGQGHDALPATVTREVYEDIVARGYRVLRRLIGLLRRGLGELARRTGYRYVVFNPHAWSVSAYIRTRHRVNGYHQVLGDGSRLCYVENLPPLGYAALSTVGARPRDTAVVREEAERYVLENRYLRVVVSKKSGWITSVYDKTSNREILGAPIRLRILWDLPTPLRVSAAPAPVFDAWEVYYNEGLNKYLYRDLRAYSHGVGERGPLYASVRLRYRYRQVTSGTSIIELEAGLYAEKPYLEIIIRSQWRAWHRLLKLLVPLRESTGEAFFETPYGVTARRDACLSKSPVDRARFEAPGHRWVDVPGRGHGVAVITDSRYGYSWCNNTLGVSLLRAATPPDREYMMRLVESAKKVQERLTDISMELSGRLRRIGVGLATWLGSMIIELVKRRELRPVDRGYHVARVWIYPHRGDYVEGGVAKQAAELNTLYAIHAAETEEKYRDDRGGYEAFSLLGVEPSNAVEVTALKPCEHGDCIAVRLFNAAPHATRARLRLGLGISEAHEADLAENPLRRLRHGKHHVEVELGPHEIKTLLIRLENPEKKP